MFDRLSAAAIDRITIHLVRKSDLLSLALVVSTAKLVPLCTLLMDVLFQSRRGYVHGTRVLYRDLDLKGDRCTTVMQTLVQRPEIATYVHSLSLHTRIWSLDLSLHVTGAAEHMSSLHTFLWNVSDASQRSEMWDRLREW
jgi:hypothetical protein